MARYIFIAILFFSLGARAQMTVAGKVVDTKNNALPGANVWVDGTYDGASGDASGRFEFQTERRDTFVVRASAVGFASVETRITDPGRSKNLILTLKPVMTQLNAVQITSGTIDISDKSSSVVMKPIDILTTANAVGDITGALTTLPGTATVANDGRLFVRGGDARETGIYFDGLRVGNAYGTGVPNVPVRNRFDPKLFQGVQFGTGGYGAEYGGALSSILDLHSVDRFIRNQMDVSIMSLGGSVSGTLVGERQSISAEMAVYDFKPYQSLIDQNIDWIKPPTSQLGHVAYRRDLGKSGLLKAFFQGSHSRMGLNNPEPGEEPSSIDTEIENEFAFGIVSYQTPVGDQWVISGGTAISFNDDVYNLNDQSYKTSDLTVHIKQKATYFPIESIKLKFGVEGLFNGYEEKDEGTELNRKFDHWIKAAFAETEWYASPQISLRGGLRGAIDPLSRQTHIEHRISAAYQPYPEGTVSLAVGNFSQPQPRDVLVQAPHLEAVEANHYQIGFQHEAQGRVMRVEGYWKEYSGFALNDTGIWNTEGTGVARGIDFFFRDKKTFENADFWLTYGYVFSRRQTGTQTERIQPSYAPTQNFSAVAKYWIEALKSQPGATFTWNSGYAFEDPNLPGQMNLLSPSYASLSVNWSFLARQNLIIYASCSNVLGRKNTFGYRYADTPNESGSYPSIPIVQSANRMLFVGVFWTLSKDKLANQLNNL